MEQQEKNEYTLQVMKMIVANGDLFNAEEKRET